MLVLAHANAVTHTVHELNYPGSFTHHCITQFKALPSLVELLVIKKKNTTSQALRTLYVLHVCIKNYIFVHVSFVCILLMYVVLLKL